MGVINLGLLVEKIKRKLEDSGFIKNTDYATASAAGVVKIGDNIDVDDGVISVTFPAVSGFTVEEIWNGTVTSNPTNIASALAHPYTDYKCLYLMIKEANATAGNMIPVSGMVSGAAVSNNVYVGSTPIVLRPNGSEFNIFSSSSVPSVYLFGIK